MGSWVVVVIMCVVLYVAWPRRMTWVKSDVTGKMYRVKNMPDAPAVADRLASLERRVTQFLRDADRYAPGDVRIRNIMRRWNGTLEETRHDPEVAYSLGKDAIALCVRNPDGSLEAENTSMFVLLHELAHVATDEYGHTPSFWANMKLLLELAEATGFYKYEDFDAEGTSYCGRRLNTSPLTCVKTGECRSLLGTGTPRRRRRS